MSIHVLYSVIHCFNGCIIFFSAMQSGYGRFVTGFLKSKSEPLTEAGQFEHTSPREPCRAGKYVEKSNCHPQLQSIPYHASVLWGAFLLVTALHLSGAKFFIL